MGIEAVYDKRGTVPLLGRDTAPDEPEHETMSVPTVLGFRRDHGATIGENRVAAHDTDASKLKFPLPMVVAIVVTALSVMGGQYFSQAGLRSDVRDILTRMELQARIAEAQARVQDERGDNMKAAIDEMRKRIDLLQLQYQQLRDTVMTTKGR